MTPRGAEHLFKMRLRGNRPMQSVWVNYGDIPLIEWWRWAETADQPNIFVRPEDPIERLDLRCLVDLDVVFYFADWDARVSRLYERLQEYASEIAVLSPCFEEDIGWYWLREVDRIKIGERHSIGAGRRAA